MERIQADTVHRTLSDLREYFRDRVDFDAEQPLAQVVQAESSNGNGP